MILQSEIEAKLRVHEVQNPFQRELFGGNRKAQ
jgi:hypothetical protein